MALLRLHIMASYGPARHAICAVKQPHVEFYRRLLLMEPLGEHLPYPELQRKMQPLWADSEARIAAVARQTPALARREEEKCLLAQERRDE